MVGFEVGFIGKLAKPFDFKTSRTNRKYAILCLDVAQGEPHAAAWVRCIVHDDLATKLAGTLKPCDFVAITGVMRLERWKDGDDFKNALSVTATTVARIGLSSEAREHFTVTA